MMPKRIGMAICALFAGGFASCTSHRVGIDPIEIKPIKVTVDVNVQVQRKLDEIFDFEDELTVDAGDEADKEDE